MNIFHIHLYNIYLKNNLIRENIPLVEHIYQGYIRKN
nr:MAG TPA: hypothetical protein [Caudoviricetes sp.]